MSPSKPPYEWFIFDKVLQQQQHQQQHHRQSGEEFSSIFGSLPPFWLNSPSAHFLDHTAKLAHGPLHTFPSPCVSTGTLLSLQGCYHVREISVVTDAFYSSSWNLDSPLADLNLTVEEEMGRKGCEIWATSGFTQACSVSPCPSTTLPCKETQPAFLCSPC